MACAVSIVCTPARVRLIKSFEPVSVERETEKEGLRAGGGDRGGGNPHPCGQLQPYGRYNVVDWWSLHTHACAGQESS